MEHLATLAAAVLSADQAYSAAHSAAFGVLDPTVKATLDLETRCALKTLLAAEEAYKTAMDQELAQRLAKGE